MNKKFKYQLAFVSIVKNEAPYIREWISYHKLVGVEKFYIYDNESTDNLKEVLLPFIEDGTVEYIYFPGSKKQLQAYMTAVKNYKNETKYMGFIDLDEFIIPIVRKNIVDIMNELIDDKDIAGIGINWRMYGSSNHLKAVDGLVTENYRYRAEDIFKPNMHIKTICNPRTIVGFENPHNPIYINNFYNIDENKNKIEGPFNVGGTCDKIRINHYFTKSKEEFMKKISRGKADALDKRSINEFDSNDKNDVYDYIMENYVETLKNEIELINA